MWWIIPPYSKTVVTNVGKEFLKLIDDEFPRDHPLHCEDKLQVYDKRKAMYRRTQQINFTTKS